MLISFEVMHIAYSSMFKIESEIIQVYSVEMHIYSTKMALKYSSLFFSIAFLFMWTSATKPSSIKFSFGPLKWHLNIHRFLFAFLFWADLSNKLSVLLNTHLVHLNEIKVFNVFYFYSPFYLLST